MYESLIRTRNELEKMSVTQTWSMRETDLFDYQRKLDRYNTARKTGKWVDDDGNPADEYVKWVRRGYLGQSSLLTTTQTLLYLVRRSLALIYSLLTLSTPVSEALLPVYSQLQTVKLCLEEVKRNGGVDSQMELYPYTMKVCVNLCPEGSAQLTAKIDSFDKMRTNGKFMVGDDVPDGQEAVEGLLGECKQLGKDLRASIGSEPPVVPHDTPEENPTAIT